CRRVWTFGPATAACCCPPPRAQSCSTLCQPARPDPGSGPTLTQRCSHLFPVDTVPVLSASCEPLLRPALRMRSSPSRRALRAAISCSLLRPWRGPLLHPVLPSLRRPLSCPPVPPPPPIRRPAVRQALWSRPRPSSWHRHRLALRPQAA